MTQLSSIKYAKVGSKLEDVFFEDFSSTLLSPLSLICLTRSVNIISPV